MDQIAETTTPSSLELDNLYTISQTVSRAQHWKSALDQIVPLLRAILIYDNLVFYLPDTATGNLEVAYARVIGRGRSAGPDISWGENIANQAYKNSQIYLHQPQPEKPIEERLNYPYLLGVPVSIHEKTYGVMVFIRFGGPPYNSDQTRIASYTADRIAQLVEYQALNDQLAELEEERRQTRLQEDFVSTITHELLTPLGFIKGYTTTLLRPDTSWDETSQREFLSIIDEETDRLQELIDNVLDTARLQSGTLRMQFQPVRLDGVINDVSLRARTHHKSLEIIVTIEDSIEPIQGDPQRLAQVFENFINNAIKYAPNSKIEISVKQSEGCAHVTAKDYGPGIPPQYLPHIFDRFYRNPEQSPNVRGTGLGLFICKQIIDAHNGKIWVESTVGEGTTFHLLLPHHQPENKNEIPV